MDTKEIQLLLLICWILLPSLMTCLACPDNCHNGFCNTNTSVCTAGCVAGYRGEDCSGKCTVGNYGQNCSGRCGKCRLPQECNHVNGTCSNGCMAGWVGHLCLTECPPFTFGMNCNRTCRQCRRGCSSTTGECFTTHQPTCVSGWKGDMCNLTCSTYEYGADCKEVCPDTCMKKACESTSGVCLYGCTDGWTGPHCNVQIPEALISEDNAALYWMTMFGSGASLLLLLILLITGVIKSASLFYQHYCKQKNIPVTDKCAKKEKDYSKKPAKEKKKKVPLRNLPSVPEDENEVVPETKYGIPNQYELPASAMNGVSYYTTMDTTPKTAPEPHGFSPLDCRPKIVEPTRYTAMDSTHKAAEPMCSKGRKSDLTGFKPNIAESIVLKPKITESIDELEMEDQTDSNLVTMEEPEYANEVDMDMDKDNYERLSTIQAACMTYMNTDLLC